MIHDGAGFRRGLGLLGGGGCGEGDRERGDPREDGRKQGELRTRIGLPAGRGVLLWEARDVFAEFDLVAL